LLSFTFPYALLLPTASHPWTGPVLPSKPSFIKKDIFVNLFPYIHVLYSKFYFKKKKKGRVLLWNSGRPQTHHPPSAGITGTHTIHGVLLFVSMNVAVLK
jgi:hypothetical protein